MLQSTLRNFSVGLVLFCALPACTTTAAAPDVTGYAASPAALAFIDEMVAEHGFNRDELVVVFSQAERREDILELMRKPAEKRLEWHEYRKIFLTQSRIQGGVTFWKNNSQLLEKAEKELDVDAQVIVAIIGVETRYGGNTGRHRVIDALSTLAFDYPPRSEFFRGELEQYLILAREEDIDLLTATGSYAGAMGYGQFIPSSYRNFAIDFDGDGKRDLWSSPADIIGSVANYMKVHRWTLGTTVATRATVTGDAWQAVLEQGLEPHTRIGELRSAGIGPQTTVPDNSLAALIELQNVNGPEYWLGLNNFYVITRYNHSPLYAMAVYQLSEEIRQAREQLQQEPD
ncbi:MAG: lytic murein transglycosylase B [Gammaproteobacteria bacterium]|nr:lytic murein transglycosylase B [Gammaproteobacteria bacterium]